MKKIRIFATALLLAFTLSSCESFFDVELDDQAKIEDIFRQKTEVQKYLSHLYSYIPQEEEVVGMHGWTVGRADESLFSWYQWVYYTQFRTGNYSSATTNFNYWPDYYIGINQCSIFLKYIDLDKEDTPATLAYMKAEARFLRAYYYFLLFRQYGPVFIWGDHITGATFTKARCRTYAVNSSSRRARTKPNGKQPHRQPGMSSNWQKRAYTISIRTRNRPTNSRVTCPLIRA